MAVNLLPQSNGRNNASSPMFTRGISRKIPILEEILADAETDSDRVAYIGDDLTDIVVMRRVGLSFATANARDEVKRWRIIRPARPEDPGAVREVCELILKAKGLWEPLLRKYEVVV